jgi:dipeptidyl aminopeptidase/acylaminoacyl peptidase
MTTEVRQKAGVQRWQRFRDFDSLYRGGRIEPVWSPDGSTVCFLNGAQAQAVDADSGEVRPLWNTPRLLEELEVQFGRAVAETELAGSTFTFAGKDTLLRLKVAGKDLLLDLDSYEVRDVPQAQLDAEAARAQRELRPGIMAGLPPVREAPSPDGAWLATEIGDDLGVRSTLDGRVRRLTDDGTPEQQWDVGLVRWAPNSLHLLAGRVDTAGVDRMLEMHWLQQVEQVEEVVYPRMGGRTARTDWFVIDRLSRGRVPIDDSLFLGGSLPLGWRTTGQEVLFGSTEIDYARTRLIAADARTGQARIVIEEETDGFAGAYFRAVLGMTCAATPLAGGEQFLWPSHRDGWIHLYRYDFAGTLLNAVTTGNFEVIALLGVDETSGYVYLTVSGLDRDRPYDVHAIRVPLAGGEPERLTEEPGAHRVTLSPSKAVFLDTHSTVDRATQTDLRRADGTRLASLSEAGTSTLWELEWIPPQEFAVKAADGVTDLYGVLYLPPDFDPAASYPVIDAIYGGPQIFVHPVTFGQEAYDVLPNGRGAPFGVAAQALAQLGFVTFIVDGRGTPARGHEFGKHNLRRMGQDEIADHVATLRQLAADRPFMDLDRVGISGGSYGGYMTLRAMLLAPEVYKVGISTAPIVDHWDTGWFHAGVIGLPGTNTENFDLGSNLLQADRLQGKLLLIHGTSDRNAPFSATMKMADALIRAGKPFDLLVVPEMNHHPGKVHGTYLAGISARYFVEHLKPDGIEPNEIPLS